MEIDKTESGESAAGALDTPEAAVVTQVVEDAERFYAKAEITITEPSHKIELDLHGLNPSLEADPLTDVRPGTHILKVSGNSPSPFKKGDQIRVKVFAG
jgi:hypothetical protein